MESLGRAEALRLLGTVSLGRVVFTQQALPAIRAVNHIVEEEDVVIGLHDGASLASIVATPGTPGIVLAYEADSIDRDPRLGWSVVVIGYADLVVDRDEPDRLAALLDPWVDLPMTAVLRIRPERVNGFRLEPEA